jgi:hypothetical protein
MSAAVLLIHGGLGERMDAERFWIRPGVLAGLVAAGLEASAPDRDTTPSSWAAAASAAADPSAGTNRRRTVLHLSSRRDDTDRTEPPASKPLTTKGKHA